MDGSEDADRFSFVGPEAIQYHMADIGYSPDEIPSISTIKRIVKRNKLRVNKKKRYKRVKSKGRYTILKPKYIDVCLDLIENTSRSTFRAKTWI